MVHPDQVKRQEDMQSQLLPKQPVWAHGVVLELITNLKGVIQDHLLKKKKKNRSY